MGARLDCSVLLAVQAMDKEGARCRHAVGEPAPSLAAPYQPRPRAEMSLISSRRPETWCLGVKGRIQSLREEIDQNNGRSQDIRYAVLEEWERRMS